ncbi:MAG TPA: T9SS type A sorting domain-containing protein [Candidatus Krumholzibacteria bacterium]
MRPLSKLLVVSFCIFLVHSGRAWAIWQQDGIPVCNQSAANQVPAVMPDGAGGVIVAWEDHRGVGSDIYVQRIDGLGVLQWSAGGVAVSTAAGDQVGPKLCSDGAGGAIMVWQDDASDLLYAQRVNSQGVPQWTPNGVLVRTLHLVIYEHHEIVPDGAGGAIISANAWDVDPFVYVQRLDSSGALQWTSDGVTIGGGYRPSIAADDAGGAVVAWEAGNSIGAARLAANGTPSWNVSVASAQNAMNSRVIWVSGVGAIVTWQDHRNGVDYDIYAQRLNPFGAAQWLANGVPVSAAAGDQFNPVLAPDAASGAILTWEDARTGTPDVYAQRVNSLGAMQWAGNGVIVSIAADAQTSPRIVPDGNGGAVITWLDHRSGLRNDVYAQRLVASGGGQWTANGFPVSTTPGDKAAPAIAPDGALSAIVAWADQRLPPNIYAQRIEFKYGYWGHPEAIVDYVTDMPLDNGGMVGMQWQASQQDLPGGGLIDHYSVWRQGPYPQPWMEVGTMPAAGQPTYLMEVPTLADATPGDPALHQFKVVAHSSPALGYDWDSNVMDGYSVDNLPPGVPLSLTAQRLATGDVSLQWNGVGDSDLDHYAVYRANTPGVTPTPGSFLGTATGTTLLDAGAPPNALYYIVTAVDVHTNEGGPSNEANVSGPTAAGETPPLTALTVLPNHPNPFSGSTELEIGLTHTGDISVEVYDVAGRAVSTVGVKDAKAGWTRVPFAARDAVGGMLPSGVYFYRVRAGAESVTRKMVITR